MRKHTSGPWVVGTTDGHKTFNITGPQGSLPYIAIVGEERMENSANARLIAAAPELLAALRAILEVDHPDADYFRMIERTKRIARNAIAKATDDV